MTSAVINKDSWFQKQGPNIYYSEHSDGNKMFRIQQIVKK